LIHFEIAMTGQHQPILTIGYGNRTIADFLRLLQKHGVRFVGDVRTTPYSRFSPDFSKDALVGHLHRIGIQYVYMGDSLGGNPDDSMVRQAGRTSEKHYVLYAKVKKLPAFQVGIERLRKAWSQDLGLALMCSEAKPEACHRTRLIGDTLVETQIDILHIDEHGDLRSQNDIMLRLDQGQQLLPSMGASPRALKSSKAFG
jgi:uncharacterized protein (DUF488 family)